MDLVSWDGNWTNPLVRCCSITITLRKNCPYSELFSFAFSRIRTEYGEILRISPYSVRIRENADKNNSKYEQFSRSVTQPITLFV